MPIRPLRVLYAQREQIDEMKTMIRVLQKVEESEEEKFSSDFRTACFTLAFNLAAYKNPAFIEEKEVRLFHVLDFEESNDSLKLVDAGGHAFGKDCDGFLFYSECVIICPSHL